MCICVYFLNMIFCLFHYNGNTTSFTNILVEMLKLFCYSSLVCQIVFR